MKKKPAKSVWKKGTIQGVRNIRYRVLGSGMVVVHMEDLPRMFKSGKVPLLFTT